jgi:hypothetical protein
MQQWLLRHHSNATNLLLCNSNYYVTMETPPRPNISQYHSTVALRTHISPAGRTISLLVSAVWRHSLTSSTWTTTYIDLVCSWPWSTFMQNYSVFIIDFHVSINLQPTLYLTFGHDRFLSHPLKFITTYYPFIRRSFVWVTDRESLNKEQVNIFFGFDWSSLNVRPTFVSASHKRARVGTED